LHCPGSVTPCKWQVSGPLPVLHLVWNC